jgi:hypothetical protein
MAEVTKIRDGSALPPSLQGSLQFQCEQIFAISLDRMDRLDRSVGPAFIQ